MPIDWKEILKPDAETMYRFDLWRQVTSQYRWADRDGDVWYWKPSLTGYEAWQKLRTPPLPESPQWREARQWVIAGWRCEGNVCQYGSDGPITDLLIRVYVPMDGPFAGCSEHWRLFPVPESLRLLGVERRPYNNFHPDVLASGSPSSDWCVNQQDPRRSEWRMTMKVSAAMEKNYWSGEHRDLLIEACHLACWEIVKRYQGESLQDASQVIGTGGRRISRL